MQATSVFNQESKHSTKAEKCFSEAAGLNLRVISEPQSQHLGLHTPNPQSRISLYQVSNLEALYSIKC